MAWPYIDFCNDAGSKIKVTSMIHMSWELLAVQIGYLTGIWGVRPQSVTSKKGQ